MALFTQFLHSPFHLDFLLRAPFDDESIPVAPLRVAADEPFLKKKKKKM